MLAMLRRAILPSPYSPPRAIFPTPNPPPDAKFHSAQKAHPGWLFRKQTVSNCHASVGKVLIICIFETNFESGSANANAEGSSVDCAAQGWGPG